MLYAVNREREERPRSVWGCLMFKGIIYATLAVSFLGLRTDTHSDTRQGNLITHKHTGRSAVCTCERILSAGPSFNPMVLSRCSSVSSGNVSPSMACSRNTWQRHSRFSHSPGTRVRTHTHKSTHSFTQTMERALFQNATYQFLHYRGRKCF